MSASQEERLRELELLCAAGIDRDLLTTHQKEVAEAAQHIIERVQERLESESRTSRGNRKR